MTQLDFALNAGGTGYEAFATVNADFNLHLEVSKRSCVNLRETTVQNAEYARLFSGFADVNDPVDSDWDGIVYPKYIHIESQYKPTKAYITEAD